LYHESVQLQLIALEPPGNVARDLALYRRNIFARLGEGSALAFPEMLPFAFASKSVRISQSELEECWDGIEGKFSSTEILISGGLLYLAMRGPIDKLSLRIAETLGGGGLPIEKPPFEAGIGFFLCRPADPELAAKTALRIGPPRADFRDCSLVRLGLRLGDDPFAAATWRELGRARRRTGRLGA
jgi:hypothetical protein